MTKPITYTVTVEPTQEPLSLRELKQYLRVTASDFDEDLRQILTAARRQVEHDTYRKLMSQTVVRYSDDFPSGDEIEIRLAPIAAVVSVEYIDADEATQTFASSSYTTDLTTTPPRIVLDDGSSWPTVKSNFPNAVIVTLTAGYATRALVPAEAKLAVKEWAKQAWSGCDHPSGSMVYQNLINMLRWTHYHCVL